MQAQAALISLVGSSVANTSLSRTRAFGLSCEPPRSNNRRCAHAGSTFIPRRSCCSRSARARCRTSVTIALPSITRWRWLSQRRDNHFHLVALANQALTYVRRRGTWDTHGRRGRKSDPAWAARRRLLGGRERLTDTQFTKMWNDRHRRRHDRADPHRLDRQRRAPCAARDLPHRRATARRRAPAAPVQQMVRPLRPPRTRAPRRHHPGLVARGTGLPADRRHQRRHRGHEPDRQDRRPHRLRLPQPRQPAPPNTVRLHPTITSGHRLLRDTPPSSSKSRHGDARPMAGWAHRRYPVTDAASAGRVTPQGPSSMTGWQPPTRATCL